MNYIHHIPGRVRVRLTTIKGDPIRCRRLKDWVERQHGVRRAEINPLTGSLLVHYQVGAFPVDRMVTNLKDAGWIASPAPAQPLQHALAKLVLRSVAEALVERSLVALAAAIF